MKQKLLLLGGSGLVGSRFIQLQADKFEIVSPTHQELDLFNREQILSCLNQTGPDAILYAAGYTNVDKAESEVDMCNFLNIEVAKILTNNTKAPVYYLSTDYVFDGTLNDRPYKESDLPKPVGQVYAQSKRNGELSILESSTNGVIRLIMPFSSVYTGKSDLVRTILNRLKNNDIVQGVFDQKINPVFVDDLVEGIGLIIARQSFGIYHLGAVDFTTPFDFVVSVAQNFNLAKDNIKKIAFADFVKTRLALRPQHTWLDTTKFKQEFGDKILHTVEEELELFKSRLTV